MASEGKLKGKVAIVTGGSRGIGKEVSLLLAGAGASVVISFQGNVAAANEAVSEIEAKGGKAVAVKGDVDVAADVSSIFDKAVEAFGAVHIVVHLAALTLDDYPTVVNTTQEEWDRIFIFKTNGKGAFLVAKEAAKRLGLGGRIILTSSTNVATTLTGYGAYAASKEAVETLTKILAKELRGKKITVNCIAPGAAAIEMFFQGKTQGRINMLTNQSPPLQRTGEPPQDIAAVVEFLASDAADWVNGHVIRVDGGVT